MEMELIELPLSKISPSAFQPRETFPKEELDELAESMKEFGLLNPILVKKNHGMKIMIIVLVTYLNCINEEVTK
ncbi:MAG: ParB N-terminal domain-containing protein [Candidatus Heimdallarchaeota archaeon]